MKNPTNNKTNNKKEAKIMTNNNTFPDLVSMFNADPSNEDALMTLASAVAHSVIKKVCDPTNKKTDVPTRANGEAYVDGGMNPTLVQIRREVTADLHAVTVLRESSNNATHWTVNADGEPTLHVDDPDALRAVNERIEQTLGDGLDLVHDAVVAILSEVASQMERDPDLPTDLLRPYSVRRLKRKVWVKEDASVKGWETVEVVPIKEVFKAVRRSIDSSRAVQTDPRNGYTYLEDLAHDDEDGGVETVYYRLPKFADLGGAPTADRPSDLAGAPTGYSTSMEGLYSADGATALDYEHALAALNLTDRQATIMTLVMRGYGNKAIATYLGVSENVVKGARTEVKRKARARFDCSRFEK